jgi:hypothetical protein
VISAGVLLLVLARMNLIPRGNREEKIGVTQVLAVVAAVLTLLATLTPFLGSSDGRGSYSGYDFPAYPCQETRPPHGTYANRADSPS